MKTAQIFVVSCLLFLGCLAWVGVARAGEIHDAANAGDVEKVKALLRTNPGLVNAKDDVWGNTPLHRAAGQGNKDVVELLLSKGAQVDAKGNLGRTPLFAAAGSWGNKDVVELLLSRGAEVNAKDNSGRTPLFEAAGSWNRKDVVELLLSKGAQVNAKDDWGETALFMASSKDVAELFLARGLDVNAKGSYGRTPLHIAASAGRKDVVELLLSRGAEVNAKDTFYRRTPLHEAAGGGHKDVVELLLSKGADVTANNIDGRSPLQVAEKNGKTDVADLLRKPTEKAADEALDEGLAAARQQQWAVAIRHFLKAQNARPTAPEVLFNLGLAESKVPGRALRAMAWLQAYLLAAPNAANAEAVRTEIANLKVRVEGAIEKLVAQAKQQAGQFSGDNNRRFAFCNVAIAQIRTGDMDGAEQTLRKAGTLYIPGLDGLDDIGKAKHWGRTWMHYKDRYEYKPLNPLPTTAKDRLDELLRLVKNNMSDEAFTDPQGALQTSAAKPKPEDILGGVLKVVEQLADTLNDIKALSR